MPPHWKMTDCWCGWAACTRGRRLVQAAAAQLASAVQHMLHMLHCPRATRIAARAAGIGSPVSTLEAVRLTSIAPCGVAPVAATLGCASPRAAAASPTLPISATTAGKMAAARCTHTQERQRARCGVGQLAQPSWHRPQQHPTAAAWLTCKHHQAQQAQRLRASHGRYVQWAAVRARQASQQQRRQRRQKSVSLQR